MNEYGYPIGPAKKILNLIRRLFTYPLPERFLLRQTRRSRFGFWKKLAPPGYLYRKKAYRRTNINGIEFSLDISNIVENLIYFGKTPENFKTVEEKLKKAAVIFDIGANVGGTALFFASQNPSAQIFSFEPHPVTFQKALTNIGLNTFGNIRLYNQGMGAAKERLKLYEVMDSNPGMNRILPDGSPYPFVWIDITTVDDFCRDQGVADVDFIKIDVEGFEHAVLTGGKDVLLRWHPVVYLELYDHGLRKNGQSARAVVSLLSEFGYNLIYNAYTLQPINKNTNLTDCDFDLVAEKV